MEVRFLADSMLGSLAKWLRILGFDTVYISSADDQQLLNTALAEGRVLLTADEQLWETAAKRGIAAVLVKGRTITEMLASALRGYATEMRVRPDRSRCAVCNVQLTRASRESVKDSVPASVYERHRLFWRCETCGRIYWAGSHVARMRRMVARATKSLSEGTGNA